MFEEEGLGDKVEKVIKKAKLDKVAKKVEQVTKKPCGCQKRKEMLNRLGQHLNRRKPRTRSQ